AVRAPLLLTHHPLLMKTHTRRLLPFFAALAAAPLFGQSETSAPSLDQALKNFAAPPASLPAEDGFSGSLGASLNEWRNAQSQVMSLNNYVMNEDYSNALNQARQYARQATAPELRKQWADL